MLGERKPPPRRLTWTKSHSDPDVRRIAPKVMQIHYLVGVSHFAECHENRPVTVSEMLINLPKSARAQWWWKWKSDPENPYPGPDHHQTLISSAVLPIGRPIDNTSFNEIGWLLLQQSSKQNDRQANRADRIASAPAGGGVNMRGAAKVSSKFSPQNFMFPSSKYTLIIMMRDNDHK